MNHLVLNISKTKEIITDFRSQENNPKPLIFKEKEVERLEMFKYLGVVLDNKLTWKNNTDVIISKIKRIMYYLWKTQVF